MFCNIDTVPSDCSVTVTPINEINFSIHTRGEHTGTAKGINKHSTELS